MQTVLIITVPVIGCQPLDLCLVLMVSMETLGNIHKAPYGKTELHVKRKLWHWITTKPESITIFKDYGRLKIQFCINLRKMFLIIEKKTNIRETEGNFTFFQFWPKVLFYDYGLWIVIVMTCALWLLVSLWLVGEYFEPRYTLGQQTAMHLWAVDTTITSITFLITFQQLVPMV